VGKEIWIEREGRERDYEHERQTNRNKSKIK
jgi:hypothetical protein